MQFLIEVPHLLINLQLACFKVDIIPHERQQFPSAQARGQVEEEHFIESFLFRLYKQALHFFDRKHLDFRAFLGRKLAMHRRILTDQSFRFCLFERGSAMGVYAPYHRVGKPFSVYLSADKPAVAFEVCVELFERSCRYLVQRNISDFRDDLIVYPLLVGGLCVRSESRSRSSELMMAIGNA